MNIGLKNILVPGSILVLAFVLIIGCSSGSDDKDKDEVVAAPTAAQQVAAPTAKPPATATPAAMAARIGDEGSPGIN